MAVGQFIDVAPGPVPGSYAFQRADGSPLIAAGPEAESMAQAIARSKAMGPQPVAQNDARNIDSLSGIGGYGNRADVPPPIPAVQQAPQTRSPLGK